MHSKSHACMMRLACVCSVVLTSILSAHDTEPARRRVVGASTPVVPTQAPADKWGCRGWKYGKGDTIVEASLLSLRSGGARPGRQHRNRSKSITQQPRESRKKDRDAPGRVHRTAKNIKSQRALRLLTLLQIGST